MKPRSLVGGAPTSVSKKLSPGPSVAYTASSVLWSGDDQFSYSQGHSSLPIGRLLQIDKMTTSYLRDQLAWSGSVPWTDQESFS